MALRRKQEEKNLAQLRQLAAQPFNKQCLDCGQRGPTYVNMTIGSFVCTSCSGRLRGLTPPHRVKSISMASFTVEEIELIKQRGNQWCKAVWLGLYDSSRHPEIDTKDDQQIKDFMVVKYEKKRYYVDPSVAFANGDGQERGSPAATATTTSTAATNTSPPSESLPAVRPLSKLAGGLVKPITLSQNVSLPGPTAVAVARPAERNNIDLLSELSPSTAAAQADPFSPSGAANTNAPPANNANFANFANFDALNAATPVTGTPRSGAASVSASAAAVFSTVPVSTSAAAAPSSAGLRDRYAALKELDEVLRAEFEPRVDWGATHRESVASTGPAWNAFGTASNGAGAFGPASNGAGAFGPASNGAGAFGTASNCAGAFGTVSNGAGAFGTASNGGGAFGASANGGIGAFSVPQPAVYGSSPQQLYGGSPHQAAFTSPQQQQQQQQQPYPAAAHFPAAAANGYSPESGLGVANGAAPRQAAGWGQTAPAAAGWPPSANPFTPHATAQPQPANPHNPFL